MRRVHRPRLFARLEVGAVHLDSKRQHVSLADLILVLDRDSELDLEVRNALDRLLDIDELRVVKVLHASPVRLGRVDPIQQLAGLVLTSRRVLDLLFAKVGELGEARVLDPNGLHEPLRELNHVLGRLHPAPGRGVHEEAFEEVRRLLEHEVQVGLEGGPDLELEDVRVEQVVALGLLRRAVLVLLLLHLLRVVPQAALEIGDVAELLLRHFELEDELVRAGEDLGENLEVRVLAEHVVEPSHGVVADHVVHVLLGLVVPQADAHGDGDDEHEQVDHEDHLVVLLVVKEGGQADRQLHGLAAVGVAELLVVLLGRLVRQRFVGLGDLHEHRLGLLVVGVLIGVELQTELAVLLLDDAQRGVLGDLQDREGVELGDLVVVPHEADEVEEHHPRGDCGDHIEDEDAAHASLAAALLLLQALVLLFLDASPRLAHVDLAAAGEERELLNHVAGGWDEVHRARRDHEVVERRVVILEHRGGR